MVEGMSIVVNVMLSLMSVECEEPTFNLVPPIGTHSGEVCTLGVFTLGVSLVS